MGSQHSLWEKLHQLLSIGLSDIAYNPWIAEDLVLVCGSISLADVEDAELKQHFQIFKTDLAEKLAAYTVNLPKLREAEEPLWLADHKNECCRLISELTVSRRQISIFSMERHCEMIRTRKGLDHQIELVENQLHGNRWFPTTSPSHATRLAQLQERKAMVTREISTSLKLISRLDAEINELTLQYAALDQERDSLLMTAEKELCKVSKERSQNGIIDCQHRQLAEKIKSCFGFSTTWA